MRSALVADQASPKGTFSLILRHDLGFGRIDEGTIQSDRSPIAAEWPIQGGGERFATIGIDRMITRMFA